MSDLDYGVTAALVMFASAVPLALMWRAFRRMSGFTLHKLFSTVMLFGFLLEAARNYFAFYTTVLNGHDLTNLFIRCAVLLALVSGVVVSLFVEDRKLLKTNTRQS